MKYLVFFVITAWMVPVYAYSTFVLDATDTNTDSKARFVVKTASDKDTGITYCSELLYVAGEQDKNGKYHYSRTTNRMYGEFGRGGRLLKYKRWLPGAGGSIMYMVFRYGSRIRQRIEEVIGGNAKVRTITRGRTIHVVDPQGVGWMLILLRYRGIKSFKCINPVSGEVGTEVITSQESEVILPQAGQVKVKVLHFGGACGEADAFLNKHGHLIGGRVGKYTLEKHKGRVNLKK